MNGHLDTLQAAILLPKLAVLDTEMQQSNQVAQRYTQLLNQAGIPTAVHYPIPLNKQPAVADASAQLPHGDEAAAQVMSLPMHPYLAEADQHHIAAALYPRA